MDYRYAGPLIAIGLLLVSAATVYGAWAIPIAWLGCDLTAVGCAYLGKGHRIFGKSVDGKLALWSRLFFLPYFALASALWHVVRIVSEERACNLVQENLVIGRRLLPREIPNRFVNYVDLTAELEDPAVIRSLPGYLAFPILDASAPDAESLRRAVQRLRPGMTFIHCAQGHGRTGLFAVALLLSTGAVKTATEGLALVQRARPGIRLSPEQRRCLDRYAALISRAQGGVGASESAASSAGTRSLNTASNSP
ncbi:MAG TPA: hypothetical protein VN493_19740 [Thermoanaerobaculia bacterium]|nr:hypothetical protein [Thermoanaerobaculia bacterium]